MSKCCSECGRPYAQEEVRVDLRGNTVYFPEGGTAQLTTTQAEILAYIASCKGYEPDRYEIWDAIWKQDVPEKGPHDRLHAHMMRIRRVIKPFGYTIHVKQGRGNSGFSIRKIEEGRKAQDAAVGKIVCP